MAKPKKNKTFDYGLVVVVSLLVIVGGYILYSTSAYNGRVKFQDEFYYLKKQFFATSLGLACMYAMANIDYHVWQKFAVPAYGLSLVLSLLVLFVSWPYHRACGSLCLGPNLGHSSESTKL